MRTFGRCVKSTSVTFASPLPHPHPDPLSILRSALCLRVTYALWFLVKFGQQGAPPGRVAGCLFAWLLPRCIAMAGCVPVPKATVPIREHLFI